MKWQFLILLFVAALFAFTLRAAPSLKEPEAREHLRKGAILVDVRTVEEYKARSLTNAVNIPLSELKSKLPQAVPDKNKVILLHCRSGRRSQTAERELRALGYTNAFNIGSFEQAEKIAR